jgi:hypothetical protein
MWEVGYAAALRKPLIVLNQAPARLPFDIADVRAVLYERESLGKTLYANLVEAVTQTLKRYSVAASTIASRTHPRHRKAIAVTGSMDCPPEKARSRLERVLTPYFGTGLDWYCGSFGTIDEIVVALLLERGETSLSVVGYSSYDISGNLLEILEKHSAVTFVDASAEQLPVVPGATSHRDVLFSARCDIIIVAWNGVSEGTGNLINWLASQSKDHIVCFVPPLSGSGPNRS